ncbi:hypothetical protein B0T24DRAFT_520060, partial [Lasiosphaeria ovina]
RYDYFPQLAKFVLRMAGIIYELIVEGFKGLVIEQLIDIRRGNDQVAADFARGIHAYGSPKIERDGDSHYPDGSFVYEDTMELGVILEVLYLQKRQDLSFFADKYILGSNRLTQAIIGIDLKYQGKEARVIVWRLNKTKENGETILI